VDLFFSRIIYNIALFRLRSTYCTEILGYQTYVNNTQKGELEERVGGGGWIGVKKRIENKNNEYDWNEVE